MENIKTGNVLKEEFATTNSRFKDNLLTKEDLQAFINQIKDLSEDEKNKLNEDIGQRKMNADYIKERSMNEHSISTIDVNSSVFVSIVMISIVITIFGKLL
ncbi:CLUMA_CG021553, isoform A [Clunio marinus]|uniref:CLUMA_CG021553, isoform A n=1 Tax=Clunio marinus TaxID=568069 RepID=A0A1J1JA52_9DIPT|nr:CLUMA_CG021553, isoform A [Clunio marinus]